MPSRMDRKAAVGLLAAGLGGPLLGAIGHALSPEHAHPVESAGASCPVLTAGSQLNGVATPVAEFAVRSSAPVPLASVDSAWLLPFCAIRVPEGRAPPAPPSA